MVSMKSSIFNLQFSKERGFSLIETLVAVVILVSAIVGPLTLAQRSIHSAVYARDQVIASFLAEEVIEYIRSVRDGNEHEGKNWLNGLSNCVGQLCMVDVTLDSGDAFDKCDNKKLPPYDSFCELLAFNASRGWYGYKPKNDIEWTDTRFAREVQITTIPKGNNSDKEAKIEVTVRWKKGNFPERSVTVRDYIYDW